MVPHYRHLVRDLHLSLSRLIFGSASRHRVRWTLIVSSLVSTERKQIDSCINGDPQSNDEVRNIHELPIDSSSAYKPVFCTPAVNVRRIPRLWLATLKADRNFNSGFTPCTNLSKEVIGILGY